MCQPSDIFCHHPKVLSPFGGHPLGGSGFAQPSRNALAQPRHFPIWPLGMGEPPRRVGLCTTVKKRPLASEPHIPADAQSASLPKIVPRPISVLSPLGNPAFGASSLGGSCSARPRETGLGMTPSYLLGRAERVPPQYRASASPLVVPIRQPMSGVPPLGGSCSARPRERGLGMQPTQLLGRAGRVPPQHRASASPLVVPIRQPMSGVPPLGGSCSARPQDGIALTKVLAPFGRRPPVSVGG